MTAGVAHQLVDHPGGDAGVLQPGREGVAQVVRAVQVQVAEVLAGGGDRGLVDAAQVVGGQRGSGAAGDAVAAARAREHQLVGPGAGGELAADGLADLLAHRHHADAGRALGLGLEAAAEPAGLIADLDDLDAPQLRVDAAAAQPEQLTAAKPGADLYQEVVAVERAAGGQEATELLRGEGPPALVPEEPVRIDTGPGCLHVPDRIGGDQAFAAGRFQDAQQDRSARHHAAVAQLALQLVLPAHHDRRGDLAQLPAAEVGTKVAAQVALGRLHAFGATPWTGRPELPPVVGPLVEQNPAAAWVGPGVGGDLGEQFVLEVAGQVAIVEGLGALGAVV